MGFRKVPLPRSALRCPSWPRAQRIGPIGGSCGGPEGCAAEVCDAGIASLLEPAAVAVAPSNSDFKVWRREYFMSRRGYPGVARAIIYVSALHISARQNYGDQSVPEIAVESSFNNLFATFEAFR